MSPERMGGDGAVLNEELERAERAGASARALIIVEGVSDRRAIEALAHRRGRDLEAEGVVVVATAGVTNTGRFLRLLGPDGHDIALAGLFDEGEIVEMRRALGEGGILSGTDDMESIGFFICIRDLEDELVGALGADAMIRLIESQGQLRRFRSFQNQPAHRRKTIEQQLWRWLGNHKIRYAPLMVDSLDLSHTPRPLDGVLDAV